MQNPFEYVVKKMQIIPMINVKWDNHMIDKLDRIMIQYTVDKCFDSNFKYNFPNYVFDKFKLQFTKENDFVMYINAFFLTISHAIAK